MIVLEWCISFRRALRSKRWADHICTCPYKKGGYLRGDHYPWLFGGCKNLNKRAHINLLLVLWGAIMKRSLSIGTLRSVRTSPCHNGPWFSPNIRQQANNSTED
jgi:hypothetical protein